MLNRSSAWLLGALLMLWPLVQGAQAQEEIIQGELITLEGIETIGNGVGIYSTPPPRPAGAYMDSTFHTTFVPEAPGATPETSFVPGPPTDAPTEVTLLTPLAPGDFEQYRNTNLAPNNTSASTATSAIDEPSLGKNGRMLWYTGNWFSGFSADAGQTWQFVDPYDNHPADGILDQPTGAGTFCCDQVVYYERQHNLMIWLKQYNRSGSTSTDSNVQRICVARSQSNINNNSWICWDFRSPNGTWYDFPNLSVSDNYLYMTTNDFLIGSSTTSNSDIFRCPLEDMADGGGLSCWHWNLTNPSPRCVDTPGTTMYCATHASTGSIRIYKNLESSTSLTNNTISHSTYTTGNMTATCADGNDVTNRADTRILAAWYSSSTNIGFGWTVSQNGGSRPYPYVRFVRVNPSANTLLQEFDLFSNTQAWYYPAAHRNDRGHVGGVINYGCGGGTGWPSAVAFINDDYNNFPDISGGAAGFCGANCSTFASSNDAPDADVWGDYNTSRRDVPYGYTWVGAGHRITGGGGNGNVVPEFIWFMRERDLPPSSNTIYVDLANTSRYEIGTFSQPYSSVFEGDFAMQPTDLLVIKGYGSGSVYDETLIFDTEGNVIKQSTSTGDVLIGGND